MDNCTTPSGHRSAIKHETRSADPQPPRAQPARAEAHASDQPTQPTAVLRAVASGTVSIGTRSFEVDVLSNDEHIFRFSNVSDVFGLASDHRNFGRTIERILPNSQENHSRPIAFTTLGGKRAHGITSAQFVALLRAFIQRGVDGKLKGRQIDALPGAWAVASALMAEGVDSIIDAALGIVREPEEVLDRAHDHLERELNDARPAPTQRQPVSTSPDITEAYASRGRHARKLVDEVMAHLLVTGEEDEATVRAAFEQNVASFAGVGGTKWGHWTEDETVRVERGLLGIESVVRAIARRIIPRKVRIKRGPRIVVNIQQLVMPMVVPSA